MASSQLTAAQIKKETCMRAFKNLHSKPFRDDVQITAVKDEKDHWLVTIDGPQDSPYKDGSFDIDMRFPKSYPLAPPKVKFETRIYHMNITRNGRVCIPLLDNEWIYGQHTVRDIIIDILELLSNPIFDSPVNYYAGELYSNDEKLYHQIAAYWTKQYASKNKNIKFDEKGDNKEEKQENNENKNNQNKSGEMEFDDMFKIDQDMIEQMKKDNQDNEQSEKNEQNDKNDKNDKNEENDKNDKMDKNDTNESKDQLDDTKNDK